MGPWSWVSCANSQSPTTDSSTVPAANQTPQGNHLHTGGTRGGVPPLQRLQGRPVGGRAFGENGENCMRIALVENEQRLRQAIRNIKRMIKSDGFA